jgi:signal transduction histidine kinase/ActR/RegA family two-component response regulator
LLAPVVRERARVLAPVVLGCSIFYVVTADAMGVHLPLGAIIFDVVLIALLAVASVACWQRRVPGQWNHVVSALVWWCPIAGTLVSQYTTHEISHAFLLGMELAAAGALLHQGIAIGSVAGATAIAVPLAVRDGAPHPALYIFTIVMSGLFALLIQSLMRKALLRAEEHRLAEADAGRKLALQLTELERAQHERSSLQEQLLHSQRMDAVGGLASGIAHDMNNILASITSLSSLALEDIDQDGVADKRQRRADLELVLAQSARGASLTQGLLAFSRRGQYRKQVVLIADVIRDVLPLLARTLPKSIEIVDRIAVGDARVDGDPLHLQQAIVNLAVNATDAMRGTGTLVISASLVEIARPSALGLPVGRCVRISVTDSGVGMDLETRRRAFEPFFTTKPLGEGKGLGLSTVWGIAQAHGGMAELESDLGRGSTVSLQLPLTDAKLAPKSKRASTRPIVHKGTVLVVDDDVAVRRGTQRILERMGFDVLAAGDGAEAIRVFERSGRIDLVVLDMGMPVMGGAECFYLLRKQSNVPILIATGYAIDAEAQALVAAGAGFIEKPFVSADFAREVTRMVHPQHESNRIPLAAGDAAVATA